MSTVTENDLKELKDLIINNHRALEKGQADLKEQLTTIDKRLAIVETRLEDWKPAIRHLHNLIKSRNIV